MWFRQCTQLEYFDALLMCVIESSRWSQREQTPYDYDGDAHSTYLTSEDSFAKHTYCPVLESPVCSPKDYRQVNYR